MKSITPRTPIGQSTLILWA